MLRITLFVVMIASVLANAEDTDPFSGETYSPSASGVLILKISHESQAERLGLKVGDIITSYAGTPVKTQDALIALVKDSTKEVAVVFQRGIQALTVTAKPGRLGVYLESVERGVTRSLPPDTHVAFDIQRLKSAPIDTWCSFLINEKKVGAEHAQLHCDGTRLTVIVEVMFDGGDKWGLNHMIETGVLDVSTPVPRVITQVHEGPLWGFRSSGRWKDVTTWELTIDGKNEDGTPSHEVLTSTLTGPVINDYSTSYLASLMPTTPGSCYHTRTLAQNSANPMGWKAIVVIGPEDVVIGDAKYTAVRMEQRSLHGTTWIGWVKDGEIIKHDYSGGGKDGSTITLRTNKADALLGLDPRLVPHTAK